MVLGRVWVSREPSVSIPSTQNVMYMEELYTVGGVGELAWADEEGKVYIVVVVDYPETYTVEKRFAAFKDLNSMVRDGSLGLVRLGWS